MYSRTDPIPGYNGAEVLQVKQTPGSKAPPATRLKLQASALGSLSPREFEVLALVGAGRTNRQIADSLVISAATAERHVHNILTKLGCANRTEAAAAALTLAVETLPRSQRAPARGLFVGREEELDRLHQAIDRAVIGLGGLVLIVGEPGIGKTRVTQEIEPHARSRGALVLRAGSHEDSGAPPYWPWVVVGRQWGASHDLAAIDPDGNSNRDELSRLFPELRNSPGFVEPRTQPESQSAQFQLFSAYTSFLRIAARRTPLVIVIDDLHWTDKPTLQLLQHVARAVPALRVLIVGTYRDADPAPGSSLTEALVELNRDPGFERIVLRGLTHGESDTLVRETAQLEPSAAVLDGVFATTEGNPFFLTEVVRLLAEQGALTDRAVRDGTLPDGVRETLRRRLSRLTVGTREVLRIAAIAGRDFSYETLNLVSGRSEDELLGALDEAVSAHIVEEREQVGRYHFRHALMQETVLDELSATRRARIHGQVGEALERRWGGRAEEFASRLTTHFFESSKLTADHVEKAFRYSRLAAMEAERQFAWPEAVALHAKCLAFCEDEQIGTEDIAPILVRLAETGWNAGIAVSVKHALRAASLYRERSDGLGFARAVIVALDNPSLFDRPETASLAEEALERLGSLDPQMEGRLLGLLLDDRCGHDPYSDRNQALIDQAIAFADEHDTPGLNGALHFAAAGRARARGDFDTVRHESYAAHREYERAGYSFMAGFYLPHVGQAHACEGHLDAALTSLESALTYARGHGLVYTVGGCLQMIGSIGLLRDDAELLASGDGHSANVIGSIRGARIQLAQLRADSGQRIDGMRRQVAAWRASGFQTGFISIGSGSMARLLFNNGLIDQAREALAQWESDYRQVDGWDPIYSIDGLAVVDDVLAELGDDEIVSLTYSRLVTLAHYRLGGMTGLDHLRGDLALRLELVDESARWYQTGLAWAERERCPVEIGRNLQGLAAVAEHRGDVPGALAYLDRAAIPFEKHGTKLYLAQVGAARQRLLG